MLHKYMNLLTEMFAFDCHAYSPEKVNELIAMKPLRQTSKGPRQ